MQHVLGTAIDRDAVDFNHAQLPIAAMVGFMMFGEAPDIWIWIGGTVIAVAAVILTRGEMANSRIEGRPR
ncbi:MAG: hypothetical protein CFH40_02628 [Alphaproteobacteria bacterium MarineAlpha10_Bin3]|nr:MAG: hypothetical protein CFH40_02628 [Alphaproteobacteria bacterium MarineAlpha10_Bin3]PPR66474.1 MAG: hypothetical protein CFH09_02628 [Alphaproteobacteria bacterium MarineAlpha4_Bin1]